MTIQLIDVVTPDIGLKTVGDKLNNNFSNVAHAASYEVGTGAGQIPRNSDLGTASTKDTGTATGQIPTADQLSMVGETVNYTGANLNPNVFGGLAAGDFLMSGVATSTTNALVYGSISLVDAEPSSITTISTFTVANASGSTTYGTGLVPVLSSASSNKFLYLSISGLSGLTEGQAVFLRQETASSKITVNS